MESLFIIFRLVRLYKLGQLPVRPCFRKGRNRWHGTARHGTARHGTARHETDGTARHCDSESAARQGHRDWQGPAVTRDATDQPESQVRAGPGPRAWRRVRLAIMIGKPIRDESAARSTDSDDVGCWSGTVAVVTGRKKQTPACSAIV